VDILFQNQDWLVINKSTGISSQTAFSGDVAVPEWLKLYRGEDVHVFSRLDKGTSGVMILARHSGAAARAVQIQNSQTAIKEYVFLSASNSVKKVAGRSWKVKTPISGKTAETF
jgi:23S rRNA-/tRNA-specific pseudouridylate synthase